MGAILTKNGGIVTLNGGIVTVNTDSEFSLMGKALRNPVTGKRIRLENGKQKHTPDETELAAMGQSLPPPTIFARLLRTRADHVPGATVTKDSPALVCTTINVKALCIALKGVHVPGCEKPTHAHFSYASEAPDDAPTAMKDRAFVGGCLCIGALRIVAGPDLDDPKSTSWHLRFTSHKRGELDVNAEPIATLWDGRKEGDHDSPIGTYHRIGGLAPAPDELVIEKWGA